MPEKLTSKNVLLVAGFGDNLPSVNAAYALGADTLTQLGHPTDTLPSLWIPARPLREQISSIGTGARRLAAQSEGPIAAVAVGPASSPLLLAAGEDPHTFDSILLINPRTQFTADAPREQVASMSGLVVGGVDQLQSRWTGRARYRSRLAGKVTILRTEPNPIPAEAMELNGTNVVILQASTPAPHGILTSEVGMKEIVDLLDGQNPQRSAA